MAPPPESDLLPGLNETLRPEPERGNPDNLKNQTDAAQVVQEIFEKAHTKGMSGVQALRQLPKIPKMKQTRVDAKHIKMTEDGNRWRDARQLCTDHYMRSCKGDNSLGFALVTKFASLLMRERKNCEQEVEKTDRLLDGMGTRAVWEGGPDPFTWVTWFGIGWYAMWYLMMHFAGFWVANEYLMVINPDAEHDWSLVLAPVIIQFGLSLIAFSLFSKVGLLGDKTKRRTLIWGSLLAAILVTIGVIQYLTMGDGSSVPQTFDEAENYTGAIDAATINIETFGFACRFGAEVLISSFLAIKVWEIYTSHGEYKPVTDPAKEALEKKRDKLVEELAFINGKIAEYQAFAIAFRDLISAGCGAIVAKIGEEKGKNNTYRDPELEAAYATLSEI